MLAILHFIRRRVCGCTVQVVQGLAEDWAFEPAARERSASGLGSHQSLSLMRRLSDGVFPFVLPSVSFSDLSLRCIGKALRCGIGQGIFSLLRCSTMGSRRRTSRSPPGWKSTAHYGIEHGPILDHNRMVHVPTCLADGGKW